MKPHSSADLTASPAYAIHQHTPPVSSKLTAYTELLLRWNRRINLVAGADTAEVMHRHVADSLQLIPLLPPNDKAIADLGSGGGFPGLVLAIATGRPFHLVEADQRKAAFLTEAAAQLCLSNVHIHACRVEEFTFKQLTAVTARALAPLPILLGYAFRLLPGDGVGIFPKGRSANTEITAARLHWTFSAQPMPSLTERDATILRITGIRPRGLAAPPCASPT